MIYSTKERTSYFDRRPDENRYGKRGVPSTPKREASPASKPRSNSAMHTRLNQPKQLLADLVDHLQSMERLERTHITTVEAAERDHLVRALNKASERTIVDNETDARQRKADEKRRKQQAEARAADDRKTAEGREKWKVPPHRQMLEDGSIVDLRVTTKNPNEKPEFGRRPTPISPIQARLEERGMRRNGGASSNQGKNSGRGGSPLGSPTSSRGQQRDLRLSGSVSVEQLPLGPYCNNGGDGAGIGGGDNSTSRCSSPYSLCGRAECYGCEHRDWSVPALRPVTPASVKAAKRRDEAMQKSIEANNRSDADGDADSGGNTAADDATTPKPSRTALWRRPWSEPRLPLSCDRKGPPKVWNTFTVPPSYAEQLETMERGELIEEEEAGYEHITTLARRNVRRIAQLDAEQKEAAALKSQKEKEAEKAAEKRESHQQNINRFEESVAALNENRRATAAAKQKARADEQILVAYRVETRRQMYEERKAAIRQQKEEERRLTSKFHRQEREMLRGVYTKRSATSLEEQRAADAHEAYTPLGRSRAQSAQPSASTSSATGAKPRTNATTGTRTTGATDQQQNNLPYSPSASSRPTSPVTDTIVDTTTTTVSLARQQRQSRALAKGMDPHNFGGGGGGGNSFNASSNGCSATLNGLNSRPATGGVLGGRGTGTHSPIYVGHPSPDYATHHANGGGEGLLIDTTTTTNNDGCTGGGGDSTSRPVSPYGHHSTSSRGSTNNLFGYCDSPSRPSSPYTIADLSYGTAAPIIYSAHKLVSKGDYVPAFPATRKVSSPSKLAYSTMVFPRKGGDGGERAVAKAEASGNMMLSETVKHFVVLERAMDREEEARRLPFIADHRKKNHDGAFGRIGSPTKALRQRTTMPPPASSPTQQI